MIALHPEFVIDKEEHKKAVIIPFNEWQSLISEVEELDDIRAYDLAKLDNDIVIPFEQAISEIKSNVVL